LFTRIIVVVAPALPLPWFFTVMLTVREPPVFNDVLLSDMLSGTKSGCADADTVIPCEWAISLDVLL
jgi:hypothetical protein